MFRVGDLPEPIAPEKLAKLAECETATIGHFLHSQFMDPQLGAVIPERRVAGTAVTVLVPPVDATIMHYAIGHARPGDFMVVDRAGDHRHACWGGVVEIAAHIAGVVGAVVDGAATDYEEIRRTGLPVWCRGPSPVTGKRLGISGAFCVPVSCGGVMVNPGDAILADESGVVVIRPDQIDWVVEEALRRQTAEPGIIARLRAGEKLHMITGAGAQVEAALKRV
ncbi:RraA family protein [Muricoccus radiodurans]|uniref:RraA family protein n=1 Tax=Muricoccus radiodurans TaxID=2231721 RepID=UPI003CEAE550